MEAKIRHLEMIQGVVNRLAQNSFMVKGWAITIITGLFALSITTKEKVSLLMVTIVPLFMFWILDGYFLWQERLFREVYSEVAKKSDKDIDFVMNPQDFIGGERRWLATICSRTLIFFYLSLVLVMGAVIVILLNSNPTSLIE